VSKDHGYAFVINMHKVDSRRIVLTCSNYTEHASIGPLVRSNICSMVGRECNSGANNYHEINEVTGMHGIGRPLANSTVYGAGFGQGTD